MRWAGFSQRRLREDQVDPGVNLDVVLFTIEPTHNPFLVNDGDRGDVHPERIHGIPGLLKHRHRSTGRSLEGRELSRGAVPDVKSENLEILVAFPLVNLDLQPRSRSQTASTILAEKPEHEHLISVVGSRGWLTRH